MKKLLLFAAVALGCMTQTYAEDHEYVDLGLPSGTLWATMNVEANNTYDFGLPVQWGNTLPLGSTPNYNQYFTGLSYHIDRWNPTGWLTFEFSKYNEEDRKETLDPEDDYATVEWGKQTIAKKVTIPGAYITTYITINGVKRAVKEPVTRLVVENYTWKTPSEEQWAELLANCTVSSVNDFYGYRVILTSKKNGKKIELPSPPYNMEILFEEVRYNQKPNDFPGTQAEWEGIVYTNPIYWSSTTLGISPSSVSTPHKYWPGSSCHCVYSENIEFQAPTSYGIQIGSWGGYTPSPCTDLENCTDFARWLPGYIRPVLVKD